MPMKKPAISLVALLFAATNAGAQPRPNDDGTVTFSYKNDSARSVMVDVQFCGRREMKRGADGTWTATVGPAAPDFYPYCYIVDGLSIMDPENPQYFPNEGFKSSMLEIPSKAGSAAATPDKAGSAATASAKDGSQLAAIRAVPHGRLEYIHYYSKSLGSTNQAVVYTPPRYMENPQKRYPVFYLISGTTDTEEVYYKVGRVNYILDNLIAEGQAREMIIVMPYGNPAKLLPTPPDYTTPPTQFGGDVFSLDLVNDLIPYVDKNFRTRADRNHRAIGGFSRGGNQALYNGLSNLDKFSYLCSYSSFTSTDIPGVYDNSGDTNKKLHLLWLGVGTDDFLYGSARDYMEFLDKKGIRSVKELTNDKYGHTWMNARYFLGKSLPLLFNKKAAEAAMKDGQPAPAATGKEKPFTPGVLARMFPKPIVSPDYGEQGITFRLKAPEARRVELHCEMLPLNIAMVRDTAGVWEATLHDYLFETFEYHFIVDGTPMADPQNMLLSPRRGFKPSIADNPRSPFHFATMGDMQHGRTGYDVERGEAWYMSPMPKTPTIPAFIQLVPGEGDTMESWFKVGGADAIADRLVADGKTRPCIITTSDLKFMQQSGMPQMPDFKVRTLRADDYMTWPQRRRALFRLLIEIGKEPAPSFPAFGGGAPGSGFGSDNGF